MEDEKFITGYCRQLDASRTVCAETVDGVLEEADCCYGSCVYQNECQIGKAIDGLLEHRGG